MTTTMAQRNPKEVLSMRDDIEIESPEQRLRERIRREFNRMRGLSFTNSVMSTVEDEVLSLMEAYASVSPQRRPDEYLRRERHFFHTVNALRTKYLSEHPSSRNDD